MIIMSNISGLYFATEKFKHYLTRLRLAIVTKQLEQCVHDASHSDLVPNSLPLTSVEKCC